MRVESQNYPMCDTKSNNFHLVITVSAEITEKKVQKEQEREREHCVWEEVMEMHDGKNKKKKKNKKNHC